MKISLKRNEKWDCKIPRITNSSEEEAGNGCSGEGRGSLENSVVTSTSDRENTSGVICVVDEPNKSNGKSWSIGNITFVLLRTGFYLAVNSNVPSVVGVSGCIATICIISGFSNSGVVGFNISPDEIIYVS